MIKCIAVDDEPLALEIMEDYIRKVPFLTLAGKFENAATALRFIQDEPVDLVFLDIKMPDITGIQFLKSLKYPPLVVFTTAYGEYALDGFNLDVVDYLLKPVPFERFLKAAAKVSEVLLASQQKGGVEGAWVNDYIFIKTEYKIIKINLEDILFIEALKDYTKIYTHNLPVLTLRSLKSFESRLPADKFIRVHRSYLVSLNKIHCVEKNTVMIANQSIPISDGYRERFYEVINRNS
ncbi:LytR/AlgR family response regulator transcription factor [Chitinophaga nivalis]|uniref:LytTR family DNA-binding domain-containing protein n=1 Tax=Chitinophaga nivalis TaxID=2991709 RepID=A0ABT3IG28_9BACT|nr:LytTR family DNA-binding domain-containing protein [Chitinophaga nivalis]MCW3467553.1 LytTR family DNA-binding domain-containing protein [Chitinophaga nivalis]MCW3482755.1 LytTR family DNA-binding domain-containing protein [Chitinophaga nivalis]